ncbi:MAG TPA: HU family DNA-binding protein, partial [Bacteroidales bacterium]|nr:HU family DNA-binding protein [Bacteroidales bacterium]
MKIAKYIGDLLYDYECVVIPGLGGFLTNDNPVSINEVTYSFSPPFRKIHFNVYLRTNDGLLVNHIAQQEQIGYKTAKQKVDQFVFQCHNALETGRRIKFQNIGSLYYDGDKN